MYIHVHVCAGVKAYRTLHPTGNITKAYNRENTYTTETIDLKQTS